jgi:hypothetical protein
MRGPADRSTHLYLDDRRTPGRTTRGDYRLPSSAPGLDRLGLIVRAADVKGQEEVAPEGIGCGPSPTASLPQESLTKNDWSGSFPFMTYSTSTHGRQPEHVPESAGL